ncbi:hypothetical protein HaLaN_22476, partial [Haematococcus lacustris]
MSPPQTLILKPSLNPLSQKPQNQDCHRHHHCRSKVLRAVRDSSADDGAFPLEEAALTLLCIFTQSCIFHGKPKLLEKATARRTAHRVMAKKKRKGSDKKRKVSRSAQGKQRQERRDGWTTRRRQVIKVPEGAVLRGCKKTRRKLREHLRL